MASYQCSKCGQRGVKLWRQYNTFADHIEMLCRVCSIVDQQKEIDESAEFYAKQGITRYKTDQIGSLVPAVPDMLPIGPNWDLDPNFSFWGYTSVRQSGIDWWQALP